MYPKTRHKLYNIIGCLLILILLVLIFKCCNKKPKKLVTLNPVIANPAQPPPPVIPPPIPPPAPKVQLIGPAIDELEKEYTMIRTYYGTNREQVNSLGRVGYGYNLASKIEYGICDVSIPDIHKAGEIESPNWLKLEFKEDANKHIVIHTFNILDKENFFKQLNFGFDSMVSNNAFLFIHGYNVEFNQAAKRTAQLFHDLEFEGIPLFYSWPSKAQVAAYTHDEDNVEISEIFIRQFIEEIIVNSEVDKLHIIGHSMGARGLMDALIPLLNSNESVKDKIGNIILAAPDIIVDKFKLEHLPELKKSVRDITLYGSSNDWALKVSKVVNGKSRLGDFLNGQFMAEGLETIDASDMDTGFLGHSYIGDSQSLLCDLRQLLNEGVKASNRKTLKLMYSDSNPFWQIPKNSGGYCFKKKESFIGY